MFIEGQCGVAGTPHRLRSSVLAGRDNYTAVWKTVCTKADSSSYATNCIKPSGQATSRVPEETKNNDRLFILQGGYAKSLQLSHARFYLAGCMKSV